MQATGAIDVYFEEKIEILVEDPDEFPVEEAKRVLSDSGIEFTTVAPEAP